MCGIIKHFQISPKNIHLTFVGRVGHLWEGGGVSPFNTQAVLSHPPPKTLFDLVVEENCYLLYSLYLKIHPHLGIFYIFILFFLYQGSSWGGGRLQQIGDVCDQKQTAFCVLMHSTRISCT